MAFSEATCKRSYRSYRDEMKKRHLNATAMIKIILPNSSWHSSTPSSLRGTSCGMGSGNGKTAGTWNFKLSSNAVSKNTVSQEAQQTDAYDQNVYHNWQSVCAFFLPENRTLFVLNGLVWQKTRFLHPKFHWFKASLSLSLALQVVNPQLFE